MSAPGQPPKPVRTDSDATAEDLDEDEDIDDEKGGSYDLLAKFYGVDINGAQPAGSADDTKDGDAKDAKSNGQYDGEADEQRDAKEFGETDTNKLDASRITKKTGIDLDSDGFDAKAYVKKVLVTQGMQGLLEEESTIKNDVRNLESDMQMLVYENYNKFISATDMIRKMKTNVESMEQEMKKLTDKMTSISNKCEHLEGALEGNRERMEKLVGVSRLLQRLQFLFELPHRLNKSIELKAYSQAVKYYKVSHKILNRYKSIASFSKISSDSKTIMHRLTKILTRLVNDPTQNPLTKMENAGLLVELGQAPEPLWGAIFKSCLAKLSTFIDKVVKNVHSTSSASSAPAKPEEVKSGNANLALLEKGFIVSFVNFAQLFEETFKDNAQAKQHLTQFTVVAFEPYFATVGKILDRQVSMGAQVDLKNTAILFRNAIKQFYRQLGTPSGLVSKANLPNKGAQVIERGIRLFVDAVMERTLEKCNAVVLEAYKHVAALSVKEEIVESATQILDIYKSSTVEKENKESKDSSDNKEKKIDEEKERETAPMAYGRLSEIDANALADVIKGYVCDSLLVVMPVLEISSYLPAGIFIGFSFSNLAKNQLSYLLSKIHQILQIGCGVPVFGPGGDYVLEVAGVSSLQSKQPGIQDRKIPMFFLLLSKLSDKFHRDLVTECTEYLLKQLKVKSSRSSESKKVDVFQRDIANVRRKYKAVSQRLIVEYTKTRGNDVLSVFSSISQLESSSTRKPISNDSKQREEQIKDNKIGPSDYTLEVLKLLQLIGKELAVFFTANEQKSGRSRQPRPTRAGVNMLRKPSSEKYVNRDIERMFRERVDIIQELPLDSGELLKQVLRIVTKAMTEKLRLEVISREVSLQIQLDMQCLRLLLPELITSLDYADVDSLLDETITTAVDRTREDVSRISSSNAAEIYEVHFKPKFT
eukprot:CAMPEP_0167752318 /NCGR_PEP_ID=MMETSP0110_2-20121227/7070_1 /TAXON_ID=629695 /ORGANISM="Gymnochlora sp., Strain CCMP2014" /LENGTH=931 /DNA_ID=CAMNT_0007637917 /DNA_START=9 /DNA_END=2801 /DNA_ORIENTATION=-